MNDKNNKPVEPEETAMSGKIDYDEIRKLVGLLEEKNLSVFELEVEGLKVKIARNAPPGGAGRRRRSGGRRPRLRPRRRPPPPRPASRRPRSPRAIT